MMAFGPVGIPAPITTPGLLTEPPSSFATLGADATTEWNRILDAIGRVEDNQDYGVEVPGCHAPGVFLGALYCRGQASLTLGTLLAKAGGNLRDALALYNGGPGAPNYDYANQVLQIAGLSGSATTTQGAGSGSAAIPAKAFPLGTSTIKALGIGAGLGLLVIAFAGLSRGKKPEVLA